MTILFDSSPFYNLNHSLFVKILPRWICAQYKGPKGVKIGCILDAEEAVTGLKLQTDIAITTPKFLPKLIAENDITPSKLRVICVDEADLALEQVQKDTLQTLFLTNDENTEKDEEVEEIRRSRLTYLVGASVTEALADLPVKDKILPKDNTFIATATSFAPLDLDDETVVPTSDAPKVTTTLKQLRLNLDPGLIHERCVAPNNTGLLTLCRLLRQELKEYSQAYAQYQARQAEIEEQQQQYLELESDVDPLLAATSATINATALSKPKKMVNLVDVPPRPRVVIFLPTEKAASSSMSKLRDAMWGDHKLCVLLPETGINPVTIMEQFKNNQTSVMLATSNSVRGLDFEGLTHVYTLYLPVDDPREYVHLAGRVGRIGQVGSGQGFGGRVTSILKEDEAEKMVDLAKALDFEFVDVQYTKEEGKRIELEEDNEDDYGDWEGIDIEDMRRQFEDTLTLLEDDDTQEGDKL